MKKAIILVATILLSLNGYSQNRKIPFFGKVKLTELCGSNDCRPAYGIKAYVHKNDKLYYNGNYNSILGRVISNSIFDTNSSGMRNITKDDVDYFLNITEVVPLNKNQNQNLMLMLPPILHNYLKMVLIYQMT